MGFLSDDTVDCHQLQLGVGVCEAGVTGEPVNVSWRGKAAWQPVELKWPWHQSFKV